MEPSRNPIHKLGNKNINCPYYERCLDHAVERRWKYWSCYKCPYKAARQQMSGVLTVHDPADYYHVPSQIYRDLTYRLG